MLASKFFEKHDPTLSYERRFAGSTHAQNRSGVCSTQCPPGLLHFIEIPPKMIVLISPNRSGMAGVGLGAMERGKSNLAQKERFEPFTLQSGWVCILGSEPKRRLDFLPNPDTQAAGQARGPVIRISDFTSGNDYTLIIRQETIIR
jgi:hypothetical protein